MPARIGKGQYFISLQEIASIFPVLQRNGQRYIEFQQQQIKESLTLRSVKS